MNTFSSAADTSRLAPILRYSGWFMLTIGTLMLALAAFGAGSNGTGGVLVLAGASILLPHSESTAKMGLAIAGAALAVVSLVGAFS